MHKPRLAFDHASVRRYDADGMLHVSLTPISKANVCLYYGGEIPESEKLGLEPEQAYRLLRDPEELRKAAKTFNNKPLLNTHIGVTVIDPPKDAIIGSTGEVAEFDGTYLKNSLVIWDVDSIIGIESQKQKEISSSYRYRLDMTPGEYQGEAYDGVMRDLVCNHVAIVPSGRAGADVFVYDCRPTGRNLMSKLTTKIMAVVKPFLAKDEQPEDIEKQVAAVIKDDATQAEKDNESEAERLKREEDELKEREERERLDRDQDRRADKAEDDEDEKEEKAADEDDDPSDKQKDNRIAMDAAIRGVERRFAALRQAERDVRPVVGELACDSADELYRTALKQLGCADYPTLPSSSLRAVFKAYARAATLAQDTKPFAVSKDIKSEVIRMIRSGK